MQNDRGRFGAGADGAWHRRLPIACYHDDLQAEPVPWHWHEELEVLVVSEGMILATAGGEKFRLEKGEGLFINAGVLHGDWPLNAGSCRLHSMVFHPRLVGGNPDSVFWQKYLQPLLTDPSVPAPCCAPRWTGSTRPSRTWSGRSARW